MNLCVMGAQSEHERVTDMNSSQKQRIFDLSVTQARWLESLKDDNQFLGDGSSSTALIKTLSSPFSLRAGAVEKMLWCCGVVVGSVFCPCLFFFVFLSSYPSGSFFPLPPFTTHLVPHTP